MVAAGAVVISIGCLMRAASTNFTSLLVFTAIYGLGFSMIFPNVLKFVGLRFGKERVGLAMGAYTIGITMGATIAVFSTLPVVLPIFNSIRGTLFIWALPSVLSACLWLLAKDRQIHASPGQPKPAAESYLRPSLWRNGGLWTIGLLLFLNDVHYYTWCAWMPSLMVMKGASPRIAAVIASSVGLSTVPAMLLMPWASYRLRLRRFFLCGSGILLAIASCAALYVTVPLGLPLVLSIGIAVGGTFPMILALPSQMLPRESAATASGIIISIGYIGAVLGPWLAGRILDATGRLDLDLVFLAITGLIWAIAGFFVPETGRPDRKPTKIN